MADFGVNIATVQPLLYQRLALYLYELDESAYPMLVSFTSITMNVPFSTVHLRPTRFLRWQNGVRSQCVPYNIFNR